MQKQTTKAKARLSDVTFDHATAHLALCSKEQGAANNQEGALILKSKNYPKEIIEKASRVQVEMSIEQYLDKFYNIWGSDARVLAGIFGFDLEDDEDGFDYDEWIEERIKSVTILKSMKETGNINEVLSTLDGEAYLTLIQEQEIVEKGLKKFESEQGVDNSASPKVDKVEPVGSKQVQKGKKLTKEVETIEKSKYVEIEKQLNDQKAELEKARTELAELQKQKAEAIIKSRSESLKAVLKEDNSVETVMKAAGSLDQEAFDALVTIFKSQADLIEKSELFKEKGVTVEEDSGSKNTLREVLQAKYGAKK